MADGDDAAQSGKYDQAFFLALAAKGKEAWNVWRRDPANKDVHVTFADVDFSEAPRDQIDFSGFEFGVQADFSKCKWRGSEGWTEGPRSFSPGSAYIVGATFGICAYFMGATFGDHANFDGATFGDYPSFGCATFGLLARLVGTTFGAAANFVGTVFIFSANFEGAVFNGLVFFGGLSMEEWSRTSGKRGLGCP